MLWDPDRSRGCCLEMIEQTSVAQESRDCGQSILIQSIHGLIAHSPHERRQELFCRGQSEMTGPQPKQPRLRLSLTLINLSADK